MSLSAVVRASEAQYLQQFPPVTTLDDVVEKVTKPLYVHALQSIKRDFLGVPMVLVFQPYTLTPDAPLYREWKSVEDPVSREFVARWRLDVGHSVEKLRQVYEDLIIYGTPRVEKYLNTDWLIVDLDRYYRDKLAGRFPPGDGIHLGDEQQALVSKELARRVFPTICRVAARRSR